MAQTTFHVNLTNQRFPHNFDELGSTIIAAESQMEQNQRISGAFSGDEAEESAGICQAYFMQNCMPTTRGYSSVSFLNVLPPIPGVSSAIDKMYVLRGDSNNIAIFAPLGSTQYVYDPSNGAWEEFEIATLDPAPPVVAYLKSRTFVFYPNIGIYEYDFVAKEFVEQQFEGISAGNILGICAAGSVLVAWDDNTIYRSSVNDPLDFVPSLSTGAGADSVLAIKGEIITCQPLGQDFVIYTAANSVVAVQTNNVQIPFTYSEIPGSCGVASPDHVTQDTNRGIHVTWCASGFQQINRQEATYIWPELSNGIIRGLMSEYDSQFGWPHLVSYNQLDVRLSFVGNRWIVVSIRDANDDLGGYTSAFVFDSSLNRWGRFDVRHRNFIDFVNPHIGRAMTYAELAEEWPTYQDMLGLPYSTYARKALISAPRSGTNFGVVLANGAVYRASYYQTGQKEETVFGIAAAQPKLILGKFKTFRTRGTMLHSFKVQRLEPGVSIRALLHSYTGQYVGTKQGFVENERHEGQFFGRANADSFSLEFAGHFHVTDLVISTGNAGRINQRRGTLEDQVFCVYNDEDCVHNKDDFCVIVGGPDGYAVYGSKTALRLLYEQGTLLNEADYTPESWEPFAQEMLDAQAVLDGPPTTQEIIDQAYEELLAAMGALVPILVFENQIRLVEQSGPNSVWEETPDGGLVTVTYAGTIQTFASEALQEEYPQIVDQILDGATVEWSFTGLEYSVDSIEPGEIVLVFSPSAVGLGYRVTRSVAGEPLTLNYTYTSSALETVNVPTTRTDHVFALQLDKTSGDFVSYVDGVEVSRIATSNAGPSSYIGLAQWVFQGTPLSGWDGAAASISYVMAFSQVPQNFTHTYPNQQIWDSYPDLPDWILQQTFTENIAITGQVDKHSPTIIATGPTDNAYLIYWNSSSSAYDAIETPLLLTSADFVTSEAGQLVVAGYDGVKMTETGWEKLEYSTGFEAGQPADPNGFCINSVGTVFYCESETSPEQIFNLFAIENGSPVVKYTMAQYLNVQQDYFIRLGQRMLLCSSYLFNTANENVYSLWSDDDGETWQPVAQFLGKANARVSQIVVTNTHFVVSDNFNDRIYFTQDLVNWEEYSTAGRTIYGIAANGNGIVAILSGTNPVVSTDDFITWNVGTMSGQSSPVSITVDDSYVYAAPQVSNQAVSIGRASLGDLPNLNFSVVGNTPVNVDSTSSCRLHAFGSGASTVILFARCPTGIGCISYDRGATWQIPESFAAHSASAGSPLSSYVQEDGILLKMQGGGPIANVLLHDGNDLVIPSEALFSQFVSSRVVYPSTQNPEDGYTWIRDRLTLRSETNVTLLGSAKVNNVLHPCFVNEDARNDYIYDKVVINIGGEVTTKITILCGGTSNLGLLYEDLNELGYGEFRRTPITQSTSTFYHIVDFKGFLYAQNSEGELFRISYDFSTVELVHQPSGSSGDTGGLATDGNILIFFDGYSVLKTTDGNTFEEMDGMTVTGINLVYDSTRNVFVCFQRYSSSETRIFEYNPGV